MTFIFPERILTITKILNVMSFSLHKHILILSVSWPQINYQFCKGTTEKNLISTEKKTFLFPTTGYLIKYLFFKLKIQKFFRALERKIVDHRKELKTDWCHLTGNNISARFDYYVT